MHSATFAPQFFDCFSIRSRVYAHYLLYHTHQNIAQSFVSVDAHLCESPNGRHSIQPIHGNALVHHQSSMQNIACLRIELHQETIDQNPYSAYKLRPIVMKPSRNQIYNP